MGVLSSSRRCFAPTKPHFFQPCLPGFTHQLSIPVAFFKNHLLEYKPEDITLRSSLSDKIWKVKISGLKLGKGWKEFVVAHGIQLGDVLVFRHEGNMVFYVTVYDSTACERDYPPYTSIKEDISSSDSDENPGKQRSCRPTLANDNNTFFQANLTDYYRTRDMVHVPTGFAKSNGLGSRRCNIIIKDGQKRCWPLDLTYKESSGYVFIGNGLMKLLTANDIKQKDSFGFEIVQAGDTPILNLISKKSSSKDKASSSSKLQGDSRLECSSFVVTLTAYHLKRRLMHLPIKFVKENGLENNVGEIQLVDDHGKIWSSKLTKESSKQERYTITRCWGQFCTQNEVKEGDSLKIEVNQHGNKNKPLLKISSCC